MASSTVASSGRLSIASTILRFEPALPMHSMIHAQGPSRRSARQPTDSARVLLASVHRNGRRLLLWTTREEAMHLPGELLDVPGVDPLAVRRRSVSRCAPSVFI